MTQIQPNSQNPTRAPQRTGQSVHFGQRGSSQGDRFIGSNPKSRSGVMKRILSFPSRLWNYLKYFKHILLDKMHYYKRYTSPIISLASDYKTRISSHELGHAIVATLIPDHETSLLSIKPSFWDMSGGINHSGTTLSLEAYQQIPKEVMLKDQLFRTMVRDASGLMAEAWLYPDSHPSLKTPEDFVRVAQRTGASDDLRSMRDAVGLMNTIREEGSQSFHEDKTITAAAEAAKNILELITPEAWEGLISELKQKKQLTGVQGISTFLERHLQHFDRSRALHILDTAYHSIPR